LSILYLQTNYPFQKVTAPPPTPTPTVPPANVVLSPNKQIVVLSLLNYPNFSIAINQNENSIDFPCSIKIVSSQTEFGQNSYLSYQNPMNYGTYSFDVWIPNPSQPETVTYYAVVQDSNGISITSNTVTVEYK
jgi:hypothetical protein